MVEHGLDVLNLHCLKSYKIRITITNFEELNFKNEVHLTLKNKGAFNNYVNKKRWVGGQPNAYVCLCGVGGWSAKCLRKHF